MYLLSHGCLLSSYKAFFSWEVSCYESYLVSHDVFIYCMMELRTSFQVSILHPRHHFSFWIIRVNLELSSLVLQNKSHSSLLAGDYVCDLSYNSNAFVWLETFHKEYSYWKILIHKYIWSCNYFSQYNIHPYLTETFLNAFHLYQDNIEIVH